MKTGYPTIITAEMLSDRNACSSQVAIFAGHFPNGMAVTAENLWSANVAGLNIRWATCLLETADRSQLNDAFAKARKAYYETRDQARKVYDEACDQARKVHDEAVAQARKVHDETRAQAWNVHGEAFDQAAKVYYEACDQAGKVYREAFAQAAKVYYEACAQAWNVHDEAFAQAFIEILDLE